MLFQVCSFKTVKERSAELLINVDCVEAVHKFKFLGTHITNNNITWSANTTAVVKKKICQQCAVLSEE